MTIVPVPKTASPACLNDYQPLDLTSVVMTCFERPNKTTDAAISQVIHSSLFHLIPLSSEGGLGGNVIYVL